MRNFVKLSFALVGNLYVDGFQNGRLTVLNKYLYLRPTWDALHHEKSQDTAKPIKFQRQGSLLVLYHSKPQQEPYDNDISRHVEANDPVKNIVIPKIPRKLSRLARFSINKFIRLIVPWYGKLPPVQVDDFSLLFYDLFLLINLSVSISFLVIHRMNFEYVGAAFNEGCLMSIFWICSGLLTGAFLNSAVDGHHGSMNTKDGGPKDAGILAAHTFINAINFRLIFALLVAVLEHRQVGPVIGEQIMQLEMGFGLILMVLWRTLHSSYVSRK